MLQAPADITPRQLALRYVVFALVAMSANIGAQDLLVNFYAGILQVPLSVFVGTAVGLVTKYVLDKRYIFQFRAENLRHDTETFFFYAAMGVFTTLIFWGFEFGFHWAFESKSMRYLGGLIGLSLGYWIKYQLDKRYVFECK